MSLINEALKRAEAEKLQKLSAAGDAAALPSVSVTSRRRQAFPGLAPMILLLLAAGGLAGYHLWKTDTGGASPKQALAAMHLDTKAQGKTALAKQVQEGPDRQDPVSAALQRGDTVAVLPTALSSPAASATVASTFRAGVKAAEPIRPPGTPTSTAELISRQKPPAPQPIIDMSQFKVSGIMSGPKGSTAIINGCLLQIGERVGQARVVKITNSAVELEIYGRRVTVGM